MSEARSLSPAAMVLCAGFGTRLQPLTDELPKPLVPIGDRSVLGHVVGALADAGFEQVVVNTHHLAGRFEGAVESLALPVRRVHERHIAGTAGGVAGAAAAIGGGDVLVYNGDILAELDLPALCACHLAGSAAATLAVVGGLVAGEGTVGIGAGGQVVRLRDLQTGREQSGGWFVGVQIVGESLRERLPRQGCLVGDGYLPAMRAGARLQAAAVARAFDDVGSPAAYLQANLRWLQRRGESSFVAGAASVGPGIELDDAIVGAGARLRGRGRVQRVVLWPDARASAPLSDAVVTTGGQIVLSAETASRP